MNSQNNGNSIVIGSPTDSCQLTGTPLVPCRLRLDWCTACSCKGCIGYSSKLAMHSVYSSKTLRILPASYSS